MLTLFFILLITMVSLTVILWALTVFLQGYIYTEPSPGVFWQAPTLAALLTVGFTIWCLSIALWTGASPINLPINAIHRFTPNEDMLGRPADKIWAIKLDRKKTGPDKDGERIAYKNRRDDQTHFHYEDVLNPTKRWNGQDVHAIEVELDGKGQHGERALMRFDLVPSDIEEYRQFRGGDGWVIREYRATGPTGLPERFRLSRLLLNLLFNITHFVVWFVGLWLILRFQMMHALGLAAILWLIVTLLILPMMLFYAGEAAEKGQQGRMAQMQENRDVQTGVNRARSAVSRS